MAGFVDLFPGLNLPKDDYPYILPLVLKSIVL